MKKYFLLLVFISLFSISLAEQLNNTWINLMPWKINTITQDLRSDSLVDLSNVHSMFCNNDNLTKDLQLQIRPWETKEICVVLVNKSSTPIKLLFWFTEWIVNENWANICQADMGNKNAFSKFIINNHATWITIAASGNSIQYFKYKAPRNASWNMLGCFGYQIDKEEKIREGNMFLVVPRKAGNINIKVTWSVYKFWRRDNIKENKNNILKIIIMILILWLITTIVKKDKKEKNTHHKK